MCAQKKATEMNQVQVEQESPDLVKQTSEEIFVDRKHSDKF